jgi:hypothetical protein
MIRKAMFALLALSMVVTSCSDDDNGNGGITPDAGVLSGGPFSFIVDGTPDFVSGISTDADAVGTNRTFVITDNTGVILGMPGDLAGLEGVDFDGAGAGVCLIWYLRYEDGLQGAAMGENANDLSGSFSLSNSITVTRINAPNAGTLAGGPFTFCVDGTVDNVSGISTDPDAVGSNSTFVITDADLNILGMPGDIAGLEGVDFDGAGAGVCLIWYLRYEDGLQGAVMGENAADLSGTFDLSNSITVTRNAQPEAGMISGGTDNTFTFTIDGTSDFVSGITLDGTATGTNGTFVITDDSLNILGMPGDLTALEGVDFNGAGVGTCLIWYLRFEDGLQGAAMGENAADLAGCFDLSNSITVNRN